MSVETISLGLPPVPKVRRTREDVEAAAPVTGQKRVLLATPRGYCAGVDRAVIAVEKALEHYGAPVYVRKQIVHNRHVVETLEKQGAIFVDEVDEVPEGSVTVFSAHGVSPAVVSAAGQRQQPMSKKRQKQQQRKGGGQNKSGNKNSNKPKLN